MVLTYFKGDLPYQYLGGMRKGTDGVHKDSPRSDDVQTQDHLGTNQNRYFRRSFIKAGP